MRRLVMTVAAIVAFGLPAAGQDDISGVRVDFTETRTRAGAVAHEMSGSLFTRRQWDLARGPRVSRRNGFHHVARRRAGRNQP